MEKENKWDLSNEKNLSIKESFYNEENGYDLNSIENHATIIFLRRWMGYLLIFYNTWWIHFMSSMVTYYSTLVVLDLTTITCHINSIGGIIHFPMVLSILIGLFMDSLYLLFTFVLFCLKTFRFESLSKLPTQFFHVLSWRRMKIWFILDFSERLWLIMGSCYAPLDIESIVPCPIMFG